MARLTVTQIMSQIAATVNQEATAPTSGGSEYNLWLEYMNRSQQEWAASHDWEDLRKVFFPAVSGTSQATVTLPLDYRKLAASPVLNIYNNGVGGEEFAEVTEENRKIYKTTDKYFMEVGNISNGFSLVFNPPTLASGASLEIQYFSVPTSLASPADVPHVPDSQFLADRTISYIFEARSDPRFQQQETKAREKLLQMVEMHDAKKYNAYGSPNYIKNGPLSRAGFRVGRD